MEENKEHGKMYYMKEFRTYLVQFLDELIEHFPQEPNFVIMRIFIKDQVPVASVIGKFIRDILPYREQSQKRDSKFFADHPFLYITQQDMDSIGKEKINYFTKLWNSDALDDNDRNTIWEWMDLFMEFANKYYTQYGYVLGFEKK